MLAHHRITALLVSNVDMGIYLLPMATNGRRGMTYLRVTGEEAEIVAAAVEEQGAGEEERVKVIPGLKATTRGMVSNV